MRKFTFFIPVLMAALLAAGQSWAAEVGTAQYFLEQGKEHFKGGNLDQAMTAYNKAIELDPKQAQFYNNRGGAYRELNHYDEAIADFNRALELNPNYANAYYNRAVAFYQKKAFDRAWDDVKKAQSLGGNINPEFLEGLRKASGREK